ncbi:MAG: BatA domain-containing protein [Gemmatimonadaceae bacterium]|nr:BatA domain-containing protein [Gemmatimonadaceae bacterium]
MGLSFLVPAFLAGLVALAVPLLLHLRNKDRDRPLRFPSLMFLQKLPIRTEQRQRITDWPLLLLRAALLALLVLAFARPVLTSGSTDSGDAQAGATVILLDRSQSMGYEGVWARAVDSARAIVNRQGAGDRVALVAYDDAAEVVQRLTTDKAAVLGALQALKPLPRGTKLAPALRTGRQVLLDAPFADAELVVVSDLQRASASGIAGVELPTGVRVRGVAVGPERWRNTVLRTLDARRVVSGERTQLAVKARAFTRGDSAARTVTASLSVNGREANSKSIALATDGETVITFDPVPAPDGPVTLRVALSPDLLAADDTLVAVVPRDDALRVALVAGGDVRASETLFFERALGIGQAPAVRVDRLPALPAGDALTRTAVLVFWDALPAANDALMQWVEQGGGLVVVAGRRVASARSGVARPGAATLLPAEADGSADRLSDRGGNLRELRMEHPLLTPFRDVPEALRVVRALRYPRLTPAAGSDVIARFDDGLPAVVEQRVGAGRVVMLALPLDNLLGDFPVQPAYLPFVRQLMLHTSGRDAVPLWRSVGERWALATGMTDPVVTAPDASLLRPVADSMGAAVPLHDAGVYAAYNRQASGTPVAVVAVNVPPSEAELTPLDTAELLLGVRSTTESAASAGTAAASPTGDATESLVDLERRQNPWRFFIMAVVALLALETWVATRGRRGQARRSIVGNNVSTAGRSPRKGPQEAVSPSARAEEAR